MNLNAISEGKIYSANRCVACGEFIEVGKAGLPDHHCSEEYEAAIEELNRLAADDDLPEEIPYGERLGCSFG